MSDRLLVEEGLSDGQSIQKSRSVRSYLCAYRARAQKVGYLRKDKEFAEADWDEFAKKLGTEFFQHIVKSGIAITLVGDPPRRLLANMEWSPEKTEPLTNVA